MNFDEWWATLSPPERRVIGEHNARFVWREAVEVCAKVAGGLWQQFQDTKEAHERNSSEPFNSGRFGFDQSTVQQSKRLMDAIRAKGQ